MRKFLLAIILPVLVIGSAMGDPAAGEGRAAAPVSKLFPFLGAYLELPEAERSHFDVDYLLTSTDPAYEDFEIWIEQDGERFIIERAANGAVGADSVRPFLDSDPTIMTTLPKGAGAVSVSMSPVLNLSEEIAMEDIQLSLSQVNSVISKRAGMMAIMAPKMKGVGFELAPGTEVRVRKSDGSEELLASNRTTFTVKPKKRDAGGTLIFSQPPLEDVFTQ